jgi:hypothetical protein
MAQRSREYVLTIVQHTYCTDCAVLKNKIAEVYIMSGLQRGEESRHWRIQIVSPPWDRDLRRSDFPSGFKDVEVPALKMEVDGRIATLTQVPIVISEVLRRLKEMLTERRTNEEMASEIKRIVTTGTKETDTPVCAIKVPEEVA